MTHNDELIEEPGPATHTPIGTSVPPPPEGAALEFVPASYRVATREEWLAAPIADRLVTLLCVRRKQAKREAVSHASA